MRKLIILAVLAVCSTSVPASTLQRLTMSDMIQKSTLIVRGKVQPGTTASFRGAMIYTHYQLSITSVFKGNPSGQVIDVAVPGGALNGIQQPVAGAPNLSSGQDSVFFLWTGKSGLTQVIGLSQGLFSVATSAQGQLIVSRGASTQTMLDPSGQTVTDTSIQMPLTQLTHSIQLVLASGNGQ